MLINGQQFTLSTPLSLRELLQQQGYKLTQVAVERNGCIVRRSDYNSTLLTDVDKLEIVSFVGGG